MHHDCLANPEAQPAVRRPQAHGGRRCRPCTVTQTLSSGGLNNRVWGPILNPQNSIGNYLSAYIMDFLTSTFAGELTGLTQQPHSTKHGNSFPCNYNNLDLDKTSFKGLNYKP